MVDREFASSSEKRIDYLDELRVLAIFLVIVNHTCGSWLLSLDGISVNWWIGVACFSIAKIAVPLFVMVSGALLLCKEDSYKKALSRVRRIAIVLVIVSVVFYLAYKTDYSIQDFIDKFWHNEIEYSFWYLYMYLGILIMLPLLQKMSSRLTKKDYVYILSISIGFVCLIPSIAAFIPDAVYTQYLYLPLFTGYLGMLFCGRFLSTYIKLSPKIVLGALVCFIVLLAFCCIVTSMVFESRNGKNYLVFDSSTSSLVFVMAACVFIVIRYVSERRTHRNEQVRKVIHSFALCSFGMYLTHMVFIRLLRPVFKSLCEAYPDVLMLILFEVSVFILAFILTWILKRIPGIKKLL